VFYGYLIGAALMVAAGLVEGLLGVNAERKSLESIARPLWSTHENEQVEEELQAARGPGQPPALAGTTDGSLRDAAPPAPVGNGREAVATAPASNEVVIRLEGQGSGRLLTAAAGWVGTQSGGRAPSSRTRSLREHLAPCRMTTPSVRHPAREPDSSS
jgi:hypothetical protein